MTMFDLTSRVAVVVGGNGVLGSAIARALGEAGAKVAVIGRREPGLAAAKLAESGAAVKAYKADAMQRAELEAAHDLVRKDLGPVAVLVNAVGGNMPEATTAPDRAFFDLPLAGLEKVVGLNLFGGAILPCQVFCRDMVKSGGSVINIASMAGVRPLTRIAGYAAAKAGVANFTQWFAVHAAKEFTPKLRVNAIAPGFFLTEQNRYLLKAADGGWTDRGKAILAHTPQDRFGNPEDLAGAAVWLASDASEFVTGTVIPVDGGFSAFSGV
jgi:NAD(P)-dependent dehydrogenase (short-subunit alcohol dehydrogenase family)